MRESRVLRFLLLSVALVPSAALSQTVQQVTVEGGRTNGAASINIASGNGNAQANVGLIAEGQLAIINGSVRQHSEQASGSSDGAVARIADGAFGGSTGWLAVSGAAGNDNQQANIAAIAFGIEAGTAGDLILSQSRASQEPTSGPRPSTATGERTADIGATAFSGSSGLVQVSLIGGDRNTSANVFALSVTGPANQ